MLSRMRLATLEKLHGSIRQSGPCLSFFVDAWIKKSDRSRIGGGGCPSFVAGNGTIVSLETDTGENGMRK